MAEATLLADTWAYRSYLNRADQKVLGEGKVRSVAKPLSQSSLRNGFAVVGGSASGASLEG